MLVWLSVCCELQLFAYGPADATAVPKLYYLLPQIQTGFTFLVPAYQVVLEKKPLIGFSSSNEYKSECDKFDEWAKSSLLPPTFTTLVAIFVIPLHSILLSSSMCPTPPSAKCAVGVRQSWLCHWCVLNVSFKGCLHCADTCMSLNTHTHHRLTALFPGQPGWAGTRKVKSIWILLKQETVSGSGISWAIWKSAPRSGQITMPTPHHSVFTCRMPFLSINQQCQSTDSYIKYSWIQYVVLQAENLLSFCHIFSVFVSC